MLVQSTRYLFSPSHTFTHIGALEGVPYLAQGHFNMWSSEAGSLTFRLFNHNVVKGVCFAVYVYDMSVIFIYMQLTVTVRLQLLSRVEGSNSSLMTVLKVE